MITGRERRNNRRIEYRNIVRYSYPSLNSGTHEMVYGVVKRLCTSSRLCDTLVNRFISSNVASRMVSPKKTWATAEDISVGGLSLVLPRVFDIGQDILVFDERLSFRPLPARVRWRTRVPGNMYKTGLQYCCVEFETEREWVKGTVGESYLS